MVTLVLGSWIWLLQCVNGVSNGKQDKPITQQRQTLDIAVIAD